MLAKMFLSEKGVAFEEVNVADDEVARMYVMAKTNQRSVPIIQIGERFVIGFDKKNILEALERR